ncbi:MAG: hypothetical protein ACRD3Q_18245 [Terriglobales bacterium]
MFFRFGRRYALPMRKRKSPSSGPKLPPPPPLPSAAVVDTEEMIFALQLFQGGYRGALPTVDPTRKGFDVGTDFTAQSFHSLLPEPLSDLFVVRGSQICPADTPLNRGMGAVMTHYKDHENKESVVLRVSAFFFLMNHSRKEVQKWTKPCDEDPQMAMFHSALFEAAAKAPTGRYGDFEPKKFFRLVAKLAADNPED